MTQAAGIQVFELDMSGGDQVLPNESLQELAVRLQAAAPSFSVSAFERGERPCR